MSAALAVQAAATFTWLGMVLAISFLEAPLKFRAPGITVPLGVGIGRLVFRALNLAEAVLALLVVGALVAQGSAARGVTVGLAAALVTVLVLGAAALRPLMDRRVVAGRVSTSMPRNALHLGYIVLEVVKVGLLVALGVATLAG